MKLKYQFSFGQNVPDKIDSWDATQCLTFALPFLKKCHFARNLLESFFRFPSSLVNLLLFR